MTATISCISLPQEMKTELSIDSKLHKAVDLVDLSLLNKPDLVCLPEAFAQYFLPDKNWSCIQESVNGDIVATMAKRAKAAHTYMLCPVLIRDGEFLKNSAVLLGRNGEYLGRYEKMVPTLTELKTGVVPGTCHTGFKTDFGRIAVAICFDLNFWEVGRSISEHGPCLICWPSMYEGGFHLRQWAYEFQCYIASSVLGGTSCIINPLGQVIACTSLHDPIVTRTIFTDYIICHLDDNFEKIKKIKVRFGSAIHIEVASPEARCMIASACPDVEIERVTREFELESCTSYLNRSKAACFRHNDI